MSEEVNEVTPPPPAEPVVAAPADWMAMPFRDWCRKVGISPSHAYALAADGKLKITKLGNRSLITRAENDRVLAEGAR